MQWPNAATKGCQELPEVPPPTTHNPQLFIVLDKPFCPHKCVGRYILHQAVFISVNLQRGGGPAGWVYSRVGGLKAVDPPPLL